MGHVYKRDEKTWYYCIDLGVVDGKRKRIKRKGGSTKKEALTALRKAENELEDKGSVLLETNLTLSNYLDYWYKEYVLLNCKSNTQDYYARIIKKHIVPAIGHYKLKNINPAILQKFLNQKHLEGYSKNSINNFYGVLSGSLKMAVYPYKYIKENPMLYVKTPKMQENKKSKEDLKVLSLDNFNKIIKRFPQGTSFYIPLQIAFHTGMRGGEVTALQWDNIDFEIGTIKVEHTLIGKGKGNFELGTPKTTSSNRVIKIGDTLINILKQHKLYQKEMKLKYGQWYTNSNWVCTKENGEHITTDSIKYLSRVVNYELMIKFDFHSLRHTHATMLLESGANIKDIQKRLGHSKLSTTMDTYSHVTDKMESETVDILESIIK